MSEFVKSLKMISGYFPFFCTVVQEQKIKKDSAVFERQGAVRRGTESGISRQVGARKSPAG
jgi:hypothetical protein